MSLTTLHIMNVMGFSQTWNENNTDDRVTSEPTEESFGRVYHLGDAFVMNFSGGINVLIGENGVGKTSVLKMLYAAAQNTCEKTRCTFDNLFVSDSSKNNKLLNSHYKKGYSYFRVSDGDNYFMEFFMPSREAEAIKMQNLRNWEKLNCSSVFIPTMEMLSHSKGFLALHQKYDIPFDKTQIDIIVNASLPEAKKLTPTMVKIANKLSQAIGGTVVQENDTFFVKRENGEMVEFSLEAEGLRKLGLLWKLIRNGLLEPGSILIWDEPEANLNPELFSLVAEILLELKQNGVQVFVATHSYNFAMYLELRRKNVEDVLFHNLYKDDGQICTGSAYRMDELSPNHIMMADNDLLDEVYEM